MATFGMDEPAQRAGRILLASGSGAWFVAAGFDELAAGEWPGWIFLGIGAVVTLTLLPMTRTELRSRSGGWTRRDTGITLTLAFGALTIIARALLDDLPAVLWIAPIWIVAAAAYGIARAHNVRRDSRERRLHPLQ